MSRPSSDEELRAVVERAAAARRPLKVVGAGHSWSDVALSNTHLVTLDGMAGLVDVAPTQRRATVQAGMRIRDLTAALARHGVALSNLGSIDHQSIAGAVSTGTHGSGVRFGNLSSQVTALRLVDGTGRARSLSTGDDQLEAARVSLGALGVLAQVELRVEPLYRLEELSYALPFDDAVARMGELSESHEHVKLWWLPHTDDVQVFAASRTKARRTRSRAGFLLEHSAALRHLFDGILRLGDARPALIPRLNRLVAASYFASRGPTNPRRRVDDYQRILHTVMPPVHREAEYAIPRARAAEALVALRRLIDERQLRVNFLVEVRFVAADDGWLSPAHRRDTCQLGAYTSAPRSLDDYFAGFEELMLALDGRPHWGKEFAASGPTLAPRYPRWRDFDALRRAWDPHGVFVNAFVQRMFEAAV